MLGDVEPQAAWKLLRPRSSASVVPFLIQGISLSVLRGSLAFPETKLFAQVARLCRRSGTTEPFTRTGKRFSFLLSSSGGGLFDGRPKTQTWVWGAFVSSPGGSLRSQASPWLTS